LVVILSLGLIVGLCGTASAVDVSVSGSYYVVGTYDNNRQLAGTAVSDNSRAMFQQQIRLQPVFKIADGLTFTARMDAMEKTWGNSIWNNGTSDEPLSRRNNTALINNANNQKIQESFEWERGWMTFNTLGGTFNVGYQLADVWGTSFGDNGTTRPRIIYNYPIGPLTLGVVYEKIYEADSSAANDKKVDADADTYAAYGIYKFTGGEAGLLYKYYAVANNKTAAAPYKTLISLISPYVKATFGQFYVESEVNFFTGKTAKFDDNAAADIDQETITAYIMAKMTLGPAYVGAQVGYASGNDPADATKDKTFNGGGSGWNPALILANDDVRCWLQMANNGGANGVTVDNLKKNMIMYNLFAGYNPTAKLNIQAALSYATAVKKPGVGAAEYLSDKYGTEIDLTATYKIYDNLSYMVAGGYLWAGDYFKGATAANTVGNDYVLLNRLMLSF